MSASDVVQETLICVYQNIKDYDEKRPFQPCFYKILINVHGASFDHMLIEFYL